MTRPIKVTQIRVCFIPMTHPSYRVYDVIAEREITNASREENNGTWYCVNISTDGSNMPRWFHSADREVVKFEYIEETASNTATTTPAIVETPTASIDVAKSQDTANLDEKQALTKQVNEAALQLDALVTYTVDEQSALINEVAALLDENWSMWVDLGKARIQARDWKIVAENTVKHAASIEKERNDFRAKLTSANETIIRQASEIDALKEQLRQSQADAELSEARLSDMRAAIEAAPRKAA